ncbi:HEPN domain-containing protein [Nocardia carnea]|uniref:ApeA N-terminal domain 1-containing protein n=1 Tax=Nocardia carnea TaxID=37328 RepID=UPI0024588567|nr:HEPN domain-containing protein [Nocardia carnea]
MTDHIFTGYWWEAGSPEKKQPGTLQIEPDGRCGLSLIEGFDLFTEQTEDGFGSLGERHLDIVHGYAGDTEITLIDCYSNNTNIDLFTGKINSQHIRARKALVGIHLEDQNSNEFRSCRIQLENFHHWAMKGKSTTGLNTDGQKVTVSFKDEKSIPFDADGCSFTMDTVSNLNFRRNSRQFPSVLGETSTTLHIDSHGLRSENGFDDLASAILDLLSLARDEPSSIIQQILVHDESCRTALPIFDQAGALAFDENGKPLVEYTVMHRSATVHTQRVFTSISKSPSRSESKPFLFTAADMPLGEVLPKWLDLRRKVRTSTDMLFSLLYARPRYTEIRMLVAAAAAEALSRSLDKDVLPMLPFDFDRLCTASLGAIDPRDHGRFLSVFRNEPNYRDRVLHLTCIPHPSAVDIVIPDREKWADDLRDARHGLAHGLQDRARTGNIGLLYERTIYLIYLVLMHELGFSEAVQVRAAESNQYLVARMGR